MIDWCAFEGRPRLRRSLLACVWPAPPEFPHKVQVFHGFLVDSTGVRAPSPLAWVCVCQVFLLDACDDFTRAWTSGGGTDVGERGTGGSVTSFAPRVTPMRALAASLEVGDGWPLGGHWGLC
jgi:hypothetical protein